MKIKIFGRPNLILNLIFLALWILAFFELWPAGMLAYGDTIPYPETISQAFASFFHSWQPLSRGIFFPQTMINFWQGIVLLPFFKWPSFAQHLFNFLPFLLSFLFINLFLLRISQNKPARFFASFFYAVNPVTIGTFIGGAVGMLYVYAFFPAIVYCFWRLYDSLALKENQTRVLYRFLIFIFYFTAAYSFGGYVLFTFAPVAFFFLGKALLKRDGRLFGWLILLYMLSIIACFLLTLPFSFYGLPMISALIGKGAGGLDVASFMEELRISYSGDPFANIGLGGTYLNEGLRYLRSVYFLGYLIPFFCFLAPFFAKNRFQQRWAIIFGGTALLILIFIYLTNRGLTYTLFLKAPGFLTFRSPAKLILILGFAYANLLAIAIDGLWSSAKEKWQHGYLLVVMLFIFVYSWPFFTGNMTLDAAKKDLGPYTIPKHFYQISDFLKERRKEEGYFRTIWLPFTYEGTELKIHWLDEDAFFLPLGWSQHGQSDIQQYIEGGMKAVMDCNSSLGQFFSPAAVKYIILDLKQSYNQLDLQGQYLKAPADQIQKCLAGQKDLKKVSETQDYIIYQNKAFRPLFTFYHQKPPKDWTIKTSLPKNSTDDRIYIKKQAETNYILEVDLVKPGYLVLDQPYHKGWQAEVKGKKLEHFSTFQQNGFFVGETGKNEIKIVFSGQKVKNILNIIFVLSWLSWLFLFVKLKFAKEK